MIRADADAGVAVYGCVTPVDMSKQATTLALIVDQALDWDMPEQCHAARRTVALILVLIGIFPVSVAAECLKPAVLPGISYAHPPDDTTNLQENEKRITDAMARQSYRAITFGDSIMFGWPEKMLAQAVGGPVLNAAIGGGTQTLIWQLDGMKWTNQTPDYIVILVGTNNLGANACEVFWGIESAISAVHAHFPSAKIVYVSLLPRGENLRDNDDKIVEINAEVKRVAAHSYTFLDAHDAFLCDHKTPCALFQAGNLHLTTQGYNLLNPLLSHAINSAMR